jgi:hypothetical protein
MIPADTMEKVSSECGKKHKSQQTMVNNKEQLLRLPSHQGSASGNKQITVSKDPEDGLQGIA